jgi:hypothetical protein
MQRRDLVDMFDVAIIAERCADFCNDMAIRSLADQQALGFHGEPDRSQAEDDSDDDRGNPVEKNIAGSFGQEHAEQRDQQTRHRGAVFEQHDENAGVLAEPDSVEKLELAALSVIAAAMNLVMAISEFPASAAKMTFFAEPAMLDIPLFSPSL